MRLLAVALLVGLAVTASAVGANPVRATMTTTSTQPLLGAPWRYTIVVKDRSGKPLAAKARLQVLVGTIVVGCWKVTAILQCSGPNAGTWISFRGKRSRVITWDDPRAVGVKLTFQATVVAAGRSVKLRAPVTVRQP